MLLLFKEVNTLPRNNSHIETYSLFLRNRKKKTILLALFFNKTTKIKPKNTFLRVKIKKSWKLLCYLKR